MNEVLVIDVGGTKTNVCLINKDNDKVNLLEHKSFPTDSNPNHEIQKIHEIFSSFMTKSNKLSLSLPGIWDKNGVLKESLFLKDWTGCAFIKKLSDMLGIKDICYETDVICGALGEWNSVVETCHGKSLLYINIGTGIGAAFLDKEGQPFKSGENLTLRLQKLVFPFEEHLTSGVELISGGMLKEISGYSSIKELYQSYKDADIEAVDIISKAQIQLAAWIINLFYLFAPEMIILNGGLTYDWSVLCEEAVDVVKEELNGSVQIIPSALKELAPIYGAYFCRDLPWQVSIL